MGIGSYDVDGDGYPDVVPDEPGRERPPGSRRRTSQPTYGDLALKLGVVGDPAVDRWRSAAVDRLAPRVPGRQQRRPHRPLRLEGQRRPAGRLREPRPVGPLPRPARRHVHPGRRGGRHPRLRRAAAGRPWPTSTSTACPTSSRSSSTRRSGSGGTPGSTAPALGRRRPGTGWPSASAQPGPNRDAIGALARGQGGRHAVRRELTVGGGHAGGQLGWVHFGLGRPNGAEVRVQWPDGTVGPWLHAAADQFATIERDATAIKPWSPPQGVADA